MNFINGILRFLAYILLAMVVLALPFSLAARDVGQLIFDAETIKELVGDNLLSPAFMAQMAQRAAVGALQGEADDGPGAEPTQNPEDEEEGLDMTLLGEALAHLEEDDWVQITSLIAPPDVVSETVDGLVDAYVDWLDNDEHYPELVLDLTDWKQNARAHSGEVVGIVMATLPECTTAEILGQAFAAIEAGEGLGDILIPICRPGEPTFSFLISNADSMMLGITQRTPDVIDTKLMQGESPPEELVELKTKLVRARNILRWTWLGVVGAAALGVLMAARSWPQALRWAGWPLLLAGAFTLMLGLGTQFLASGGLEGLLLRLFDDAPATLAALGTAVAAGALPLVARPLLLQGGFMLLLGAGALLGSGRLRAKPDDDHPELTNYA